MYFQISDVIETEIGNSRTHVPKLTIKVYCQKQAGRVWDDFTSYNISKIGFKRNKIDKCVFYRGNLVLLVYIDDAIFVSFDRTSIESVIKELMSS